VVAVAGCTGPEFPEGVVVELLELERLVRAYVLERGQLGELLVPGAMALR
jgi:hypothetical protein